MLNVSVTSYPKHSHFIRMIKLVRGCTCLDLVAARKFVEHGTPLNFAMHDARDRGMWEQELREMGATYIITDTDAVVVEFHEMLEHITKEDEKLSSAYDEARDKLGDAIRNQIVIPYCNRTKREFSACNGTWSFFDDNGIIEFAFDDEYVDGVVPTKEDRYVCAVLDFCFDKDPCCIGSQIAGYKP